MTLKNANIVMFSIVALFITSSFGFSNVYAEENEGYKMIDGVTPVLTFTFREGVETYSFPVFEMGENLISNSGVSFSVEGSVTHSPLLHEAMDEAYKYRYSNTAFDYHLKYFDVDASFVDNNDKTILSLNYNNCRISNYQIETLDSNDYESYFKEVGFAIVDKIDFVCSGVTSDKLTPLQSSEIGYVDYGSSGFGFANDMKTFVTFTYSYGTEKIEFPVFNLTSAYAESTDNVVPEFSVEGILEYYPLLYAAIDNSRKVSGLSSSSHIDFDALVEFSNGEYVVRGFDFTDCRVSNAQITTKNDKEEGFTGKSAFAVVHQLTFTCSGLEPVNKFYDELRGDTPIWKSTHISNEYVEPLQNTDKELSTFATFTFPYGIETIEFSMFKQNEVLTATEQVAAENGQSSLAAEEFTRKVTYPTIELRGIVGNYPMLYKYVDDNRIIQGIAGTQFRDLVDIDIDLVSDNEVIRGFNYSNCRPIDYKVATEPNKDESYAKNKFALENVFDFECQGYHPNNPVYDTMYNTFEKAETLSTNDLRNTDRWGPGFTVK